MSQTDSHRKNFAYFYFHCLEKGKCNGCLNMALTWDMLSSSSSTRSSAAFFVSASSNRAPTSNTLSRYAWICTCSLSLSVCFSFYSAQRQKKENREKTSRRLEDLQKQGVRNTLTAWSIPLHSCILTSRYSSKHSLVKSYWRCTLKFISSTEWTTIFMNCIHATWKVVESWMLVSRK